MTAELHPLERELLKALNTVKVISVDGLSEHSSLNIDQVRKGIAWLVEKGFTKETSAVSQRRVSIPPKAVKYISKGFPEKQVLEMVRREDLELKMIRSKLDEDEFNYAVGFLKKNGFISILNGVVSITSLGLKYLTSESIEEKIFKFIAGKGEKFEIDKKYERTVIELLADRGLIESNDVIHREYSITETGRDTLESLREDIVEHLTPDMIRTGRWGKFRKYDINAPVPRLNAGKKHFLRQAIEATRQIWLEMGFREMKGPILDAAFWNFDALYTPQDHPARTMHDTFYVKNPARTKSIPKELLNTVKSTHEDGWTTGSTGWGYKWNDKIVYSNILRTHTTILSAKTLYELRGQSLPAKFFSVSNCFRNEALDWKHLAEFHQVEGIVVGEDVTFRQLLGYLKNFFSKMGFPKARFRPGYFPYTEMSTEIDVYNAERRSWVEFGGAGMFRPEVVKPLLGREIPVLAWGPGFGRYVNEYYNISDIRIPYKNDLKLLRDARLWLRV